MKAEHLQRCQVETPPDVVDLIWKLARRIRPRARFTSVLDLGAGDGRFGKAKGVFEQYTGIEMDASKVARANLPLGSELVVGDALDWQTSGYLISIGNPPYIRHHGLDPQWRDQKIARIASEGGPTIKKTANVFVMFLAQSLLRTREDGLVIQLVPYEWVTRPSASELRDYIRRKGWDVYVYRFDADIFPTVLTTASVTIIDKSSRKGQWKFGKIGRDGQITAYRQPSGSTSAVLAYSNGVEGLHAIRGLSPGGQDIFVLTEEQRLYFGLRRRSDVVPCATSLRHLDDDSADLTAEVFEDRFVAAGKRCWLIRSDRESLSPALEEYLDSVGETWKKYSTCTVRDVWWKYKPHPVPQLLISSGFTKKSPKVLVNSVKAIAAGSVYGIVADGSKKSPRSIVKSLRGYDFQRRVVHHSNNLKKLEVRQLNAVLDKLFS